MQGAISVYFLRFASDASMISSKVLFRLPQGVNRCPLYRHLSFLWRHQHKQRFLLLPRHWWHFRGNRAGIRTSFEFVAGLHSVGPLNRPTKPARRACISDRYNKFWFFFLGRMVKAIATFIVMGSWVRHSVCTEPLHNENFMSNCIVIYLFYTLAHNFRLCNDILKSACNRRSPVTTERQTEKFLLNGNEG